MKLKKNCRVEIECEGADGEHFGKFGLVTKIENDRASVLSDTAGVSHVLVSALVRRNQKECKLKISELLV